MSSKSKRKKVLGFRIGTGKVMSAGAPFRFPISFAAQFVCCQGLCAQTRTELINKRARIKASGSVRDRSSSSIDCSKPAVGFTNNRCRSLFPSPPSAIAHLPAPAFARSMTLAVSRDHQKFEGPESKRLSNLVRTVPLQFPPADNRAPSGETSQI